MLFGNNLMTWFPLKDANIEEFNEYEVSNGWDLLYAIRDAYGRG